MKMKHILGAFAGTLLFASQVHAQQGEGILNSLSLEAGYGFNTPFGPTDGIKAGDFTGFNSFHAGVRYQINDLWGIRGTYAFNKFEHKDNGDFGLKQSRLMLEAMFNVTTAINGSGDLTPFELFAHGGLGLSQGKSNMLKGEDMMGNFQIGIMPSYNINERISVFLDATYVMNFSQNFGYNGLKIDKTSGSFLSANLGVSVKLGN